MTGLRVRKLCQRRQQVCNYVRRPNFGGSINNNYENMCPTYNFQLVVKKGFDLNYLHFHSRIFSVDFQAEWTYPCTVINWDSVLTFCFIKREAQAIRRLSKLIPLAIEKSTIFSVVGKSSDVSKYYFV